MVYWDYRDMGIAYDKSFDTDKITLENILEDTEAVTEYLKTRFGKDYYALMYDFLNANKEMHSEIMRSA